MRWCAPARRVPKPGAGAEKLADKGADIFVEDRLFATLDPLTRDVSLGSGSMPVVVTDTVGFIRKLPHHLVASFRATLEEVREADLLIHVIDAGNSPGRNNALSWTKCLLSSACTTGQRSMYSIRSIN